MAREYNGAAVTMMIVIKIILPNNELILYRILILCSFTNSIFARLNIHEFRYMIENHLFI